MGIRTDHAALLDQLRDLYRARLVVDEQATDDFSVHAPVHRGRRAIPTLFHGRCPIHRFRSLPRLLRALDVRLGQLGAEHPGHVRLANMSAVIGDDRAVLVPQSIVEGPAATTRLLTAGERRIADAPAVLLDLASARLRVLPGLAVSDDHVPSPLIDETLALPGWYSLSAVHWLTTETTAGERPSIGAARFLQRITDRGELGAQELLDGVAALSDRFRSEGLDARRPDVDAIVASLRS